MINSVGSPDVSTNTNSSGEVRVYYVSDTVNYHKYVGIHKNGHKEITHYVKRGSLACPFPRHLDIIVQIDEREIDIPRFEIKTLNRARFEAESRRLAQRAEFEQDRREMKQFRRDQLEKLDRINENLGILIHQNAPTRTKSNPRRSAKKRS